MRGPLVAAVLATVYAVLAQLFDPFLLVCGAIVSLSALRHGDSAALQILVSVVLAAGSIAFFVTKGFSGYVLLAGALLPLVVLATVLRRTENQGIALSIAALFALGFAAYARYSVPNVDEYWMRRLQEFNDAVEHQGGQFLDAEQLSAVASMMHASTILLVMLFLTLSLFLGRWWQASLYNPGGFGTEFRKFVLPKSLMIGAAAVSLVSLVALRSNGEIALIGDMLLLAVILFAMQGLAVVHHRAHVKEFAARPMFVCLYIFLVILPHIFGFLLAIVGIADNVVDFRRLRSEYS
ncbi:MAG: hypothetical protein AAF387_00280 [Pseudomonadota bacterium]